MDLGTGRSSVKHIFPYLKEPHMKGHHHLVSLFFFLHFHFSLISFQILYFIFWPTEWSILLVLGS